MTDWILVSLACAEPGIALQLLSDKGTRIYGARLLSDEITLRFYTHREDYDKLQRIATQKGYTLALEKESKRRLLWHRIRCRPVLVGGISILLFLAFFLPTRVLFIQIEGNVTVPSKLILQHCAQCGIGLGASRRAVRSETAKNMLLEEIPQLQWVGVTTDGCVATISVRERMTAQAEPATVATGICAARDGLITRMTVTGGTAVCRVGQVVREGQLLVSGYTDCGICIRMGNAQGEIYGQTQREISGFFPTQWRSEARSGTKIKKFSLIIGKKRINFSKGSGISGAVCDKMYAQYDLTLPGGFVLPVSLVVEECFIGDCQAYSWEKTESEKLLTEFARQTLREQMNSGAILIPQEFLYEKDGVLRITGLYACEELISQIRYEEIVKPNE